MVKHLDKSTAKIMICLGILLTILHIVVSQPSKGGSQPSDPVWPDKFQQTFNETFYYPVIGTHYTTGKFYYDWKNKRYRVDRANGRFDRYCGFNGVKFFQDTPCSHIVVDGWRWMVYPEKKECCR